jgi:hypothetical protein
MKRKEPRRYQERAKPTLTQIEMIDTMNRALGTSYAIPATERDARFLIDGMIEDERKRKRTIQT